MKFSIIIPLYNKQKFIKHTLESVLNQTFSDFEIIVVNDGSTDNSTEIVQSIDDDRIKLYSKENGGVSSARNFGIKKAKGNYIAFLDADDYWDPNYLNTMNSLIEEYNKNEVFGCCNAEVKNKNKVIPNPNKHYINDRMENDYQSIFIKTLESPVHTSAVIFKRELLNKYRFEESISMGEDLLLWLEIFKDRPIIMTSKILSFYNRDDANAATASLKPLNKTFIPRLHKILLNHEKGYNTDLINNLILNMLRPYYLKKHNDTVDLILKTCDLKSSTAVNKIFYGMPVLISKTMYKIYKFLT